MEKKQCYENETVSFECTVSKDNAPVKWYKNGKEIKPDKRHQITVDGKVHKLTITGATLQDAAEYSAKIKDAKTAAPLVVTGETIVTRTRR